MSEGGSGKGGWKVHEGDTRDLGGLHQNFSFYSEVGSHLRL